MIYGGMPGILNTGKKGNPGLIDTQQTLLKQGGPIAVMPFDVCKLLSCQVKTRVD